MGRRDRSSVEQVKKGIATFTEASQALRHAFAYLAFRNDWETIGK
jgi:hypothetical protein